MRRLRRASVLMETVIVMPVLLLLIFGLIQFAHIWTARQMVTYAAFCATRAIMVVPPSEQETAAQNAAEIALSWINLVDKDSNSDAGTRVTVPGWGWIKGSGLSKYDGVNAEVPWNYGDYSSPWKGKRVDIYVRKDGQLSEIAAVTVKFRFPLIIPGMAVNKIIAWATQPGTPQPQLTGDFYADLNAAAGSPSLIDGWPYIELTETCVLPMPYSTKNFPRGAFDGVKIREGGGS